MKEIYIFGHKKPDTDTVTSAISLSYLKNKLGLNTKPMILGDINKETEFVLNYFNIKTPEHLEDVNLQVKDVNYYKNCFLNENTSLKDTYEYMHNKNITGVPLVDDNQKFMGLLTSKMIGKELIDGDFCKLISSYNNIQKVLKADAILKYDDEINGCIIATPFKEHDVIHTNKDKIAIVGSIDSLNYIIDEDSLKLIIIIGSITLTDDIISKAVNKKINIMKTYYDAFHTVKLIYLSNYSKNLVDQTRSISFNENDDYSDFKKKCEKLGYNNYPVIDDNNKCLGLIRITNINTVNKKQVILVDHNEASQSVEGLEDAEILEIVDHHNIGNITTNMPINFRNMTVGSTNTIVYSLYNESNVVIPKDIAGIMLSGIISDTLMFTSPTTTNYDIQAGRMLASIAEIDIDTYSKEMFKAGSNVDGKTLEDIIQTDMKTYEVDGKKIAIAQIITYTSINILNNQKDYINKLNEIKNSRGFDLILLCVTDIIKGGSYIFYDEESEDVVASAFTYETIHQGYFFSKILSRKKQLVPLLMNSLR